MEKAFQYKNVIKTFPEFKLGPLNLDLEPGTMLGFVGPNGSGKTTTMQCLVGLLRADSGEMEVFGNPSNLNKPAWKLDIGYVGDIQVFYERWTGQKNLDFLSQFYPNWSNERVHELAKRFNLPLHKRAKDLSTGNRVKLSLVAALAHSPRLLLLDEPTSGIDPVVRIEVLDVLFEILESGERAIFYATHILPEISRLADELAFIDNGNIWLRTPKEDLTEKWRKITFLLARNDIEPKSTVSHQREGHQHQIISTDCEFTLEHLRELGAENIQENHMTIEEIAVQILKGGTNVATT
ncbi:MAG: ATP-binding cassette domain-containing protein [Candidatus Aminicenantes bacterium]|jgi:ABC-2 type transport system ATP-binding protein|nr:ATP-binding cassette domain-containing protein [Candidatus Aminicenantes bacterium]